MSERIKRGRKRKGAKRGGEIRRRGKEERRGIRGLRG